MSEEVEEVMDEEVEVEEVDNTKRPSGPDVNFLSFDDIQEVDDRKKIYEPVPEWGGHVCLIEINGKQRDAYTGKVARLTDENGNMKSLKNVMAMLVQMTLVNPDTLEPLYTVQQIDTLNEKSGAVINRLFEKSQKLSALREEDLSDKAKNSEKTPKEDGGSSSPTNGESQLENCNED